MQLYKINPQSRGKTDLILDCAASWKRVIDLWWHFATEEGDNDFIEILTTNNLLPFVSERCAATPKQASAHIDGLKPIDGDQTIALFSLGLWLRSKFGLDRNPLYEALSYANSRSIAPLKEFAVAMIGWCVDETPPGSHLERLILLYPAQTEAEEPLADWHS